MNLGHSAAQRTKAWSDSDSFNHLYFVDDTQQHLFDPSQIGSAETLEEILSHIASRTNLHPSHSSL